MMTTVRVLTAERVDYIFRDCLFRDGENTDQHIRAEGIIYQIGFHPGRIQEHRAEIVALLDELPDVFKESGGGGMSFLQACIDKHGIQWTGEHATMEQLFLMGLAIKKVHLLMPRELWNALPGGMPYYVITKECKDEM